MFDTKRFRSALAQFGTGVTVATTFHDNQSFGLTSNSFASVSLEPPLVLWSIKKTSQSYGAFVSARHFAINVLALEQSSISGVFAKSGGDKFVSVDWVKGLGGCPLISGAAAQFECERWALYEGGDHTIIVGEVKDFRCEDRDVLLFSQGRYSRAVSLFPPDEGTHSARDGGGNGVDFITTLLRNAHGVMWIRMEAVRREMCLSHVQAAILYALRDQPGLKSELLPSYLGFGLTYTDVELQRLIAEKQVQVDPEGRLSLTSDGLEKFEVFLSRMRATEDAVTVRYSGGDLDTLRRVLSGIVAADSYQT